MAIDADLNKILKEMWRLDELRKKDIPLTEKEKKFFNTHWWTMIRYYSGNTQHWIAQDLY